MLPLLFILEVKWRHAIIAVGEIYFYEFNFCLVGLVWTKDRKISRWKFLLKSRRVFQMTKASQNCDQLHFRKLMSKFFGDCWRTPRASGRLRVGPRRRSSSSSWTPRATLPEKKVSCLRSWVGTTAGDVQQTEQGAALTELARAAASSFTGSF